MNTNIELLVELSKADCSSDRDDSHDYDHCPTCLARHYLNEIGVVAQSGLENIRHIKSDYGWWTHWLDLDVVCWCGTRFPVYEVDDDSDVIHGKCPKCGAEAMGVFKIALSDPEHVAEWINNERNTDK